MHLVFDRIKPQTVTIILIMKILIIINIVQNKLQKIAFRNKEYIKDQKIGVSVLLGLFNSRNEVCCLRPLAYT